MTQNPWHIVKTTNHAIGERAIVDSLGFTICNPSPMGAQTAALISVAPELLEALFLALPFVEDHEDSPTYKAGAVAKALQQIRTALNKATEQTA